MKFEDLATLSEQARRFSVALPGENIAVSCVLPTRLAERELYNAHITTDPGGGMRFNTAAYSRALWLEMVRGWTGVRMRHLVPEAGQEPLPFSPEASRLVASERTDWLDAVTTEAEKRLAERRKDFGEDEKNLPSASAGN